MINVSVIIPTYCRPDETKRCIELLSKSEGIGDVFSLEYIVVDDSPDTLTAETLAQLPGDLLIKYKKLKRHTGIGEKRNMAALMAGSELLLAVDTDIEVELSTVIKLVNYLKDNPGVARVTGTSIFTDGRTDRPTKWDRVTTDRDTAYIEGIYGRYELTYKKIFLELGGYDPIFVFRGEGTDLSIRYWRGGYPLAYAKDVKATHNEKAAASATRSRSERVVEMYRSLILVIQKYGMNGPDESKNFINSHQERIATYGDTTEYYSLLAGAKLMDWAIKNRRALKQSKKLVPTTFDFKPFDVFSNKELLGECIATAPERIKPCYDRVFAQR